MTGRGARGKKIAATITETKGGDKKTRIKNKNIVDKDIADPLYISEDDMAKVDNLTSKRARDDDNPLDSDEDYNAPSSTKRIKKRNLSDDASEPKKSVVNVKSVNTKKKTTKGKSADTNGDNGEKSDNEMISEKVKGKKRVETKRSNESLPDIVLSVKSIEKEDTKKLCDDLNGKGEKRGNGKGKKVENKIVQSAELISSQPGDNNVISDNEEIVPQLEDKNIKKGKSLKATKKKSGKVLKTVLTQENEIDGLEDTEKISEEKEKDASKGKGRKGQKKNKTEDNNIDKQIDCVVVQEAPVVTENIEKTEEKTAVNGRGRRAQNKKHDNLDVEISERTQEVESKPVLSRGETKVQNKGGKAVKEEESVSESSNKAEKIYEGHPGVKKGRARKLNKPSELESVVDAPQKEILEPEKPIGRVRGKILQKQQLNEDELDNKDEHLESEPQLKQTAKGKRNAPKKTQAKEATEESAGEPVPKKSKSEDKKPALKNQAVTAYEEIDFSNTSKNSKGEPWNIKICSWNVDGIRAWLSKGGLDYIKHEKPDILCLQETKCAQDKLPTELTAIPGYHPYWLCSDQDGYAGVAIYTTKMAINVQNGIQDEELDSEGRIITAEYEQFYLICTYVPNAGRKLVTLPKKLKWNEIFHKYVKKLDEKKPVIICGDMNVAHNEIDLANPKTNKKSAGFTPEEREGMTKLLGDGFVDTYRHLHPEKTGAYTFWTYMMNSRAKNVGWRLDYMIVSERLLPTLCDHIIRSDVYGSDHCPITLMLHLSSAPKLPKE